ncbi:phosphate/phosphite/phosphonate ABC transporter substrate-binding protein [Hydrogenophaga sp. BPS33]|uniref:phosphate/phosphite/phosphonate ABC transporter substrate-binding protein n=1 Tax=Hydrogenophaga sp. BPS33 TaxID=2651974 RepID=UPI00131FF5DC|nr:PhnD/SsuA/transferrin family substrate-binding protein [Hydrogenophaga sp. BPS33]QHE86568.1 phosphate/phosphite/phosphonate ABC transporter substrate-binding protein [Hydrogenophaga sp. BPS33]
MKALHLCAALALAMSASALHAKDLILAISEGTSGGTDHARVIAKYQGLADVIGKSINQKVNVVFIREFASLEEGMKARRFSLAMARPSDFPARGMRDYGYKYVASAKPDGQCLIVVPKESDYKTLADIKGKRIVLPEIAAYMAKFCASALRDEGIDIAKEKVQRVREQAAVPFYLTNKFADVGGVASYSGVAKSLDKTGQRVLFTSASQPYFPLIADREFTAAQIDAMQRALRALPESEAGQDVLKSVGIKAFDTTAEKKLGELLGWLGL